jgi:hypothetical protein
VRTRVRCGILFLTFLFAGSAWAADNPVPQLDQPIAPASAVPGGPGLTLTVRGAGFVSGSVVNWNSSPRTTTFVSAGKITASIPATDIAIAGTATVTVVNPSPGGGTSNALFFEMSSPVGNPQFTPIVQSNGINALGGVITGDFNGDGKLDVAYTNAPSTELFVQLGNGDGSFQAPLNSSLPPGGGILDFALATADFNRDGKLDLVVLGESGPFSVVNILLGNGDGTFQLALQSPSPFVYFPSNIFAADFNGDGNVDLLLSGSSQQTPSGGRFAPLVLYRGNGDGTFQTGVPFDNLAATAIGDFNGDGVLDLAFLGGIALGNGDGTFQAPMTISMSQPNNVIQTMIAADVNGDGKLDLVLGLSLDGVGIMLGNGDGTFQSPVNYPTGPNSGCGCDVLALTAADFDGDGKLDLLVGVGAGNPNSPGSPLWIFLGNGDGTFQPPVTYSIQGFSFRGLAAVGDFNNDGRMDFVVAANAPSGPGTNSNVTFYLQGRLPVGSPAPTTLDFGSQNVGSTSAAQAVTLTNSGLALLTISNISIEGANAGEFVLNSGCGASLAPSANCQISIAFAPGSAGALTVTLAIHDNSPGSPQTVGLTGSGTTPPASAVNLSPSSLTFSSQFVGTAGLPQTITLTNRGTAPLNITSVGTTADFGQLSTCGNSLTVGASCAIGVFFVPTAGGTRTGTLTVTDDAGNSPQTVSLTGTGQDFSVGASGAASATITAGQTATYTIAFAPAGGFSQPIALSCSGAPAQSTCMVTPTSLQLNGTSPMMATVTVMTAAKRLVLSFGPDARSRVNYRPVPQISALLGTFVMVVGLVVLRRGLRLRWALPFALAALVCLDMTLTSCGGGSQGRGRSNETQAGTYTITVSGIFTSGSTTLTHTAKLTLVVQ